MDKLPEKMQNFLMGLHNPFYSMQDVIRVKKYLSDYEIDYYTYCHPTLTLVSVVFMGIFIAMVTKKKLLRSQTYRLILFIGLCDLLCLLPMAVIIPVLTVSKQVHGVLEYTYCHVFLYIGLYLPSTFHSISLWTKVIFSSQRFILIQFPVQAKNILQSKHTKCVAFSLMVLAVVVTVPYYICRDIKGILWVQGSADNSRVVYACFITNVFSEDIQLISHTIGGIIIPIIILLFIDIVLLYKFKVRSRWLKSVGVTGSRCYDSKGSYAMLMLTALYTLQTITIGIMSMFLQFWSYQYDNSDIDVTMKFRFAVTVIIYITCPVNALIYGLMGKTFRTALTDVIPCGKVHNGSETQT